jgi:uncharacterized protein DUF6328
MQRPVSRFGGAIPAEGAAARAAEDHAWSETRTLTLAVLLMLGFQFRSGFEPGLARMPEIYTDLKLGSLGLSLLALGWLALPASYHRLVPRARERDAVRRVASRSVSVALVPLALSVGLEVTVAAVAIAGAKLGWTMGGASALLALLLWYGLRVRSTPAAADPPAGRFAGIALPPRASAPAAVDRKIDSVLSEIRLVLPGAQALLLLQLSVALMQGFDTLPDPARRVYLASLGLMALATILLITPVAYHRIAQRGESTDRVHRVAGAMLIAGMAVLALALSGDVYVAASRVARFTDAAAAAAAGTALFFYFLWFAVPLFRRRAAAGSGGPRLERG